MIMQATASHGYKMPELIRTREATVENNPRPYNGSNMS